MVYGNCNCFAAENAENAEKQHMKIVWRTFFGERHLGNESSSPFKSSPLEGVNVCSAVSAFSAVKAVELGRYCATIFSMGENTDSWRNNLVTSREGIKKLLDETRRIAVLGIKPDPAQPANYVAVYAQNAGYEIVPVPVYYKELTEMLGEKVYREVNSVPGDVDMVNVFRRPRDIPPHLDDIIAKKPKSVWFQLGIVNDEAAEILAKAGIAVVQDRCLLVELQRIGK